MAKEKVKKDETIEEDEIQPIVEEVKEEVKEEVITPEPEPEPEKPKGLTKEEKELKRIARMHKRTVQRTY